MYKSGFALLFPSVLVCCFGLTKAFADMRAEAGITPAKSEVYVYEAYPAGSQSDASKETIRAEILHFENSLSYVSTITQKNRTEVTKINMKPDGTFISGTREEIDDSGEQKRRERIWREKNKVYAQRYLEGKSTTKQYRLPDERMMAVDASLLGMLRSFPFEKNKAWDLFMIDFSQRSVRITVRQSAIDSIEVPAGKFECYRMEVTVNLFLFHPQITYWITKQEPHFLVKHHGKRGPFTPTYDTALVWWKN
jgi:hypothetical protein